MLPSEVLSSTSLFLAASYVLITFLFPLHSTIKLKNNVSRWKSKFLPAIAILLSLFAVKLSYEIQHQNKSYYSVLEISRFASPFEVRQAYKRVSKKMHPDKNIGVANAEQLFQEVKVAYDILMDEQQRDIYNRFGEEHIKFDPRQDELKLISSIGIVYLGWGVLMYIFTLPTSAQSCRTWVAIIGLVILALEVAFCLSDSTIPDIVPFNLTEHELVLLLHSSFPMFAALLRCVSEMYYVDVEYATLDVLGEIASTQSSVKELLDDLKVAILERDSDTKNVNTEVIDAKLQELRLQLEKSETTTSDVISLLKNSTSSLGASYYWVIFVVMYAGVYFLQ